MTDLTNTISPIFQLKSKLNENIAFNKNDLTSRLADENEDRRNKKIHITYYSIISDAIESSPSKKMKVNEIYEYLKSKYSEFNKDEKKWQNSIRHALSYKKFFIRQNESDSDHKKNRGSYWVLSKNYKKDLNSARVYVKRPMSQKKMELTRVEKEWVENSSKYMYKYFSI